MAYAHMKKKNAFTFLPIHKSKGSAYFMVIGGFLAGNVLGSVLSFADPVQEKYLNMNRHAILSGKMPLEYAASIYKA